MDPIPEKMWNRDFSLLMLVQVLAMFGNTTLSFVLPLYILDVIGSPALFGLVLALAAVPLILMTPFGGVIADRASKQRVIFWMDVATTVIIALFLATQGLFEVLVPVIILKLIVLNVIQGIYMPTAMSAVRFLVPRSKLVPANAVGAMVFSLSNSLGPALGSILYASLGLFPVLAGLGVLFALTAILDLFLRIPFKKQEQSATGTLRVVAGDLSGCARFGTREKPLLGSVTLMMFLASIPTIAMLIVSFPVLVTQTLGLGMELLGVGQGIMMGGGVLGGVLAGALEKRLTIRRAHWVLLACGLFTLPMGLVFMFGISALTAFVILSLSAALVMLLTQIVLIQILAYVQLETPAELVGKAVAVVMALAIAAYPIGQLLFGMLLERFARLPWAVMFAAALLTVLVALRSRRYFRQTE